MSAGAGPVLTFSLPGGRAAFCSPVS